MGGGESKIIKGLDHAVGNNQDSIQINTCDYITCPPEYFTNKHKLHKYQITVIIIMIILIIYFILIYNSYS